MPPCNEAPKSTVICRKNPEIVHIPVEEVKKHNQENDCWVIEKGYVYDVTKFLQAHPGGSDLILKHAGNDITDYMSDEDSHLHSSNAFTLLNQYRIGKVSGINNNNDLKSMDEQLRGFTMDGYKEDLIDWDHGLVFQVHKLGKDYLKWVHSPVNRDLKLFDSKFVEFFSKTPWYMVPIIWIPMVFYFSLQAFQQLQQSNRWLFPEDFQFHSHVTFVMFSVLFLLGLPTWTLIEYILHRFLFHLEPSGDSPYLITFHFFIHGQHHKVPFDNNRLVFPPVAAAVFCSFFLYLWNGMLPGGLGVALFSGGLLGYIAYDMLHYYFHHGSPARGSYLHRLKYYHVLHHFDDHDTGFGISTKIWDYPFGTVNTKA